MTARSYLEESLGAQAVEITASETGEDVPELAQCAQKTAEMLRKLEEGAPCNVINIKAGSIRVQVGEAAELFTFPKTTEERVA